MTFQGLIMGNLRVLPPALKDIRAYTFLLKRSNIGRMDATTRSFHGVSGGCCDIIIPSVYIASVSVSTTSGESLLRTHAHACVHGRPRSAQHRFNRNQSTISRSLSRCNATRCCSSDPRGLSRARTRIRGNTRGKPKPKPVARAVGGLWCGRRSAAFANPNTFIYVPCSAFSFFSLFLSVSSYVSFDRRLLWSSLSLSLWGFDVLSFPTQQKYSEYIIWISYKWCDIFRLFLRYNLNISKLFGNPCVILFLLHV